MYKPVLDLVYEYNILLIRYMLIRKILFSSLKDKSISSRHV